MTGDNSTQFNHSLSLSCGVDCPLVANSNTTCILLQVHYSMYIITSDVVGQSNEM